MLNSKLPFSMFPNSILPASPFFPSSLEKICLVNDNDGKAIVASTESELKAFFSFPKSFVEKKEMEPSEND